jgi:hypothetical protein
MPSIWFKSEQYSLAWGLLLPATLATWGVVTGYPDTGYPTLATHKADTGYPDTSYPTLATQRWRHWLPPICNLLKKILGNNGVAWIRKAIKFVMEQIEKIHLLLAAYLQ